MNRQTVLRIVERVMRYCGGVRRSDGDGIVVGRVTTGGGHEDWRVRCGSGIAGNAGSWWIEPVSGLTAEREIALGRGIALGPYRTARAFERGLRRWKRWENGERTEEAEMASRKHRTEIETNATRARKIRRARGRGLVGDLVEDPAGKSVVVRVSDGRTLSLASGDLVDFLLDVEGFLARERNALVLDKLHAMEVGESVSIFVRRTS